MATRGVRQLFVLAGVVVVATVTGMYACHAAAEKKRASGFVSGTGRIEASEIPVATNLPGRIDRILVQEGQSVRAGQVVAHVQAQSLVAERAEAYARYKHALHLAASAEADVLLRETQAQAAAVAVQHHESEFQAIARRLSSAVTRLGTGAVVHELDELRAEARRVAAVAAAADAQLAAARVAVVAARLDAESAHAGVEAADAMIHRVETILADAVLTSPRDADVQSRVAQPGDVVPAGSPVLTLLDTTDVRITFALPEAGVDGVRVGDEARIVLDTLPQSVIRATISTVGSAAPLMTRQNIANEHQRPMCRLTAQLDRAFIHRYLKQVKSGASGVVVAETRSRIAVATHAQRHGAVSAEDDALAASRAVRVARA